MADSTTSGPAAIVIQRRVEWSDTDASGQYHSTAAVRLFEAAEDQLMSRLGLLHATKGRLPRVHVEVDFRRPLRTNDLVDVHIWVDAVGTSSLTFRGQAFHGGALCAEGRVVTVLLDAPGGEKAAWSDEHRALLTTAGAQIGETLVDAAPSASPPSHPS